jgi:serine/threonine protein kinase
MLEKEFNEGLPLSRVYQISNEIVEGLIYLHLSCFIVHGYDNFIIYLVSFIISLVSFLICSDLKPENILIQSSDSTNRISVVLSDFGNSIRFNDYESGKKGNLILS